MTSSFSSSTVTVAGIAVFPIVTRQFQFEAETSAPKLSQSRGAKIFMPGACKTLPGASRTFPPGGSTALMRGGRSLAAINRKTARTLGVTIPAQVYALANEVIE